MSERLTANLLVARFLKSNGYVETFQAFLTESGLPDNVDVDNADVTIEKILVEKKVFDLSLRFEKAGVDGGLAWSKPAPGKPTVCPFESPSNVLQAIVADLRAPGSERAEQCLLASTADKKLSVLPTRLLGQTSTTTMQPGMRALEMPVEDALDSPALDLAVLADRYVVFTTMAGGLGVLDGRTGKVVARRRDHTKYAVRVVVAHVPAREGRGYYVATAGWDRKIFLYFMDENSSGFTVALLAELTVESLPESMLFGRKPESAEDEGPYLVYGRRDSTFLYYCLIQPTGPSGDEPAATTLQVVGRQNLAPHANSWATFSPSCLAASPLDPTLMAIATGSPPHMKVIVVRLLFPHNLDAAGGGAPAPPLNGAEGPSFTPEQAAAARREGAGVDPREAAAVVLHTNTLVEQSNYSYPVVVWRPDGSGVWVNSEEGSVKGIDLCGKIVATLAGHERGSKVRCLYAGFVDSAEGSRGEVLVSGGFDRRLIVWTAQ